MKSQQLFSLSGSTEELITLSQNKTFEMCLNEIMNFLTYPDESLDEKIFLILNIYPNKHSLQDRMQTIKVSNIGSQKAYRKRLSEEIVSEVNYLLPMIKKVPISYLDAEKRIATMHFEGNLATADLRCDKVKHDYSSSAFGFNLEHYKKIRQSASLKELKECDERTKQQLTEILTGYYIYWYYDYIIGLLDDAEINIYMPCHTENSSDITDRFAFVAHALIKRGLSSDLKANALPELTYNEKSRLIFSYCDYQLSEKIVEILDTIGEDCMIRDRICTKRKFAEICYLIKEKGKALKFKNYSECQKVMAQYYAVPVSSYKINDIWEDAEELFQENSDLSGSLCQMADAFEKNQAKKRSRYK